MELNYRLTLTLTVDGQARASSVVHRVKLAANYWPGGPGVVMKQTGEALVMDLGQRGVLLLVGRQIDAGNIEDLFAQSCAIWRDGADAKVGLERARSFRGSCEVRADDEPLYVRIASKNSPLSMTGFTRTGLAQAFGPGVSFKSLELSFTEDDITREIVTLLPWIAKMETEGSPRWYNAQTSGLPAQVYKFDLI